VVDFLLVCIELFLLGVTVEALRANIGSKSAISLQRGPVNPKFQVEGVAPTNQSFYQKTTGKPNDLWYGIKIWTDLSSTLSQCTRLTDRQTEFSLLDRVCIPCSAVMIQLFCLTWYKACNLIKLKINKLTQIDSRHSV